ncbi:lipid II-degrading bacteriocin [Pseudomonas sp. TNT2022 ID1025]|uniref:Lipid II-degrading bacteriocin n=2 Tax=Pseudomonas rubra TaxID=2942627 RepID=A0ABT5P755_9PSED|nr:lipid II-degrading bacteriocin [Pseudomonas rubra]MDD1014129.1 lipid II-degrading bacteriocin [Pseudomonas rubra]MDD1039063.1 lipid II-degrading bacteriocin [Pseudomonas rubra]MDD1154183.1 lipid II-degrading bacteriocin [Pseudomonas rubra]
MAKAWAQRDDAYVSGNWWAMLCLDLKRAQYNRPPFSLGLMAPDLLCSHHADQLIANDPNLPNQVAWRQGRIKSTKYGADKSSTLSTEVNFSGGIFTPLKALAHAIYGNGATTTVPLENTGIEPTVEKTPELKQAIDSAMLGSSSIDINVTYYTGQDSFAARVYLGDITLRIIGTVNKDANGKVEFSGHARAYNDRYDGDANIHRLPIDEALTTALRAIMKNSNATSYQIKIPGSLPIVYSTK